MTETPTLRKKPQPLLTLNAQVDAKGQVDSRIPVRWCVSKRLIEELKEQGFKNPQLLLVVRSKRTDSVGGEAYNDYADTSHLITPITRELAYVSFTRPGQNEIIPMVVDVRDEQDAKTLGMLRRGCEEGGYRLDGTVIDGDGSLRYAMSYNSRTRKHASSLKYLQTNFTLAVNVPKEMFAPDPSDKAKAFVNRFFGSKGTDQCGFRKRFIASLLWTPLFVLFGTIAKIILILGGLLLTKREYNFWHLRHPFSGEILGVIADTEKNTLFWWQHKNRERRAWPFFVWNYIGVILLPSLVFWAMQAHKHGDHGSKYQLSRWGWWKTVVWLDGIYLGILAAGLVLVGLYLALAFIKDKLSGSPKAVERARKREERKRAAQRSASERRAEEVRRELEAMICTPGGLTNPPSLKDLPKNKLTVSLVFNGAKTAVCKPFAR